MANRDTTTIIDMSQSYMYIVCSGKGMSDGPKAKGGLMHLIVKGCRPGASSPSF